MGVNTVCSAEQYLNVGSSVKSGDWAIHSIKRLSDGEVFTVGDRIKVEYRSDISEVSGIEKFEINPNIGLIVHYNLGMSLLENLEHQKQVILITENGVGLFEGDKYWFIWKNSPCKGQYVNTIYKGTIEPLEIDSFWSENAVFFSIEDSAKEWIKQNEKIYSLNDIKKALNYYRPQTPTGYTHTNEFLSRLNKY